MPTLQQYEQDYNAPDKEEVIANIKKYGTDDRSKWQDAPPEQGQPAQPAPPANNAQAWNQGGAPAGAGQGIAGVQGAMNNGGGGGQLADDQQYNGMSRDQFRDQTMGMKWGNPAEMQAWMQARGASKVSDNGTYRDPWGRVLDMGIGAKSGGVIQGAWTPTGGGGGGGVMTNGGPGATPGGMNYAMDQGVAGGNPGAPGTGDLRNDLVKRLMERSNQSLQIDRNDPTIRAQVDPYAAQQTREMRNYIADQAERGGPNANLTGERRMAAEHAGQASGLMESQAIGNEQNARRQEIAQALSGLQGQLTSEQQQALSRELAQLNAEISRRGQDINWQQALLQNDQFGRQLNQNESQFGRNLGLQAEDRYNYWDTLRRGLQ